MTTIEEVIAFFEDEKEFYESASISRPNKRIDAYEMALEALNQALNQPELLSYNEQCIFLAAMGREKKLCEKLDKNQDLPSKNSLIFICEEIERKVKATLWRENNEQRGRNDDERTSG